MNELLSTNFLLPILIGIGLVAATGFRIFLPLFIVSLLTDSGSIDLNISDNWSWIGTDTTMMILGLLAAVEIVVYYIPILDNFLDKLSVPLAAIAGIFIFKIVLPELINEYLSWVLAIVIGGGVSFFISATMTAARDVSTITTRGEGNFVISTVETLCSVILIFMSIYLPVLCFFFVLFILYSCYYAYSHVSKRKNNILLH
ncbi:DUF4126 domain-containing protein [Chishuiella sp.]|uniref:DUF4126 domain-containing protein n=1 Tax=Chishuiella sp. TaxID=1969467 RepID=UPI0028A824C2|nr:DUF4126 domain-containing protein [Chishuiella sp.]